MSDIEVETFFSGYSDYNDIETDGTDGIEEVEVFDENNLFEELENNLKDTLKEKNYLKDKRKKYDNIRGFKTKKPNNFRKFSSQLRDISEKIISNSLIDVKIKKIPKSFLNIYSSLQGRIVDSGIYDHQECVWVKIYHNNRVVRFPLNHISIL